MGQWIIGLSLLSGQGKQRVHIGISERFCHFAPRDGTATNVKTVEEMPSFQSILTRILIIDLCHHFNRLIRSERYE